MKTNQIIKRPMGAFVVEQRTKDGMFNATALLKDWNKTNPNEKRDIETFLLDEESFSGDFEIPSNMLVYLKEDGILWLNKLSFNNFLIFLSPELFFVDWQDSLFFQNIFPIQSFSTQNIKPIFKTYLLTDNSGLYKIGRTTDIERRLKSIAVANPNIRLICSIPRDLEKELHQKFAKKRVSGEWFRLSLKDVDYIRDYNSVNKDQ